MNRRRRRRHSDYHHTKTGNERWLVSYADFVTLLFAFFVVMYSVSQVSEKKYQVLSETLSSIFEGKVPVEATVKQIMERFPDENEGEISGLSPSLDLVDTKMLASEIQQALINMVDPDDVKIMATEDWVQIEVNSNLLFSSASARPSKDAQSIFADIAKVLAPYTNEVEVSGHTDDVPINNSVFNSNWELSSARASSIVRLLEGDGVASSRLSAVGYGEYRPVADNNTEEGRRQNRRVVLMLAKQQVERPIQNVTELQEEFPLSSLRPEVDSSSEVKPEATSSEEIGVPESAIEPVRLKGGGLLFTSDSETSR